MVRVGACVLTGRRAYSRTGLNALKARVKVRGLHAIDRRTAAARALLAWRSELLADLGGEETVSAQQMALVDMAVRTRLYVDSLDVWIMEQESLVNRKRKSVLPVLRERQQLVDSLARILGQLGLERKAKPIPALAQYIAEKYQGEGSAKPELESKSEGNPRLGGRRGGRARQSSYRPRQPARLPER